MTAPTCEPRASTLPVPRAPAPAPQVLSNVYLDVEAECQGWLSVSTTRTAVYAPGNPAKMTLVWVDRQARTEALSNDQDLYREVTRSIAAGQLRIARPASGRLGGGLEQIGVAKFDSPILGGGAENFRRSGAILDLGPIRDHREKT